MNDQTRVAQNLEQENATLKRLVAELEQKEAFFRTFVEGTEDLVIQVDATKTITYANHATERIFGVPPHTCIGKSMFDFIHPDDQEQTQTVFNQWIEHHAHSVSWENRQINQNGEVFHIYWTINLRYDDQGNIFVINATGRDVTAQKQIETQLRNIYTLTENTPDVVGTADLQGNVTYANPAWRKFTGYIHDATEINIAQVYAGPPEELAEVVQHVFTHHVWHGIWPYLHKNGTVIPAPLSLFLITNAAGQPQAICGITRDLSEQQRLEEEQNRAKIQEQIIEAQHAALRELSSPLIPLSDKVVLLPLIGTIDTQRAQQVMETLLEGVAKHRSDVAIIDITGVSVVDTQVANAIIQATKAVRLLGAQVILTGIGPAMAQTLVHLGADLSNITTRGTLQSAIAHALKEHM